MTPILRLALGLVAVGTIAMMPEPVPATGAFTPLQTDTFSTGTLGPSSAWNTFLFQTDRLARSEVDTTVGAVVARVWTNKYRIRQTGAISTSPQWLPYSQIGPGNIVRAKFFLYANGQQNPADKNQVPNIRMRLGVRFAQTALFELLHHQNQDPGNNPLAGELRPATDPANPSMYRLDLDPVDVPALGAQAATEGVQRAFEAYALEPQENGVIGLSEVVVGVYPASLLPDSNDAAILKKVYEPSSTDAGNMKTVDPWEAQASNWINGTFEGDPITPDPSVTPKCTYAQAGLDSSDPLPGVTLDASQVLPSRVGVFMKDFNPGPDVTDPSYVRVEPGKQYKVRYHLVSTRQANQNANIRMRVRSARFAWVTKFELGAAYAAGSVNNSIAQQTLPGVGCLNPDRINTEPGGWYSALFTTPLSPEVRPEVPGATLAQRMPLLSAEPGPGQPGTSRRDLKVGLDLLDSISVGPNSVLEVGNVTCDRIEVRAYDLVED